MLPVTWQDVSYLKGLNCLLKNLKMLQVGKLFNEENTKYKKIILWYDNSTGVRVHSKDLNSTPQYNVDINVNAILRTKEFKFDWNCSIQNRI